MIHTHYFDQLRLDKCDSSRLRFRLKFHTWFATDRQIRF